MKGVLNSPRVAPKGDYLADRGCRLLATSVILFLIKKKKNSAICTFLSQIKKIYISNLHALEIVGRGSKTQVPVVEDLKVILTSHLAV